MFAASPNEEAGGDVSAAAGVRSSSTVLQRALNEHGPRRQGTCARSRVLVRRVEGFLAIDDQRAAALAIWGL